jgi:hypothetical protein
MSPRAALRTRSFGLKYGPSPVLTVTRRRADQVAAAGDGRLAREVLVLEPVRLLAGRRLRLQPAVREHGHELRLVGVEELELLLHVDALLVCDDALGVDDPGVDRVGDRHLCG